MSIRKSLLSAHRWVGLVVALLLLGQGITGGAILFGDALERAIHPELVVVPAEEQQSVQAMLSNVRASYADQRVTRIVLPAAREQAALFHLASEDGSPFWVAVDPYRNHILREGGLLSWPVRLLTHIHEELLLDGVGATIVGFGGIALLFMAITGPVLWWPGRMRIRQALRVRWDKGLERGLRQLHRSAGAIGAILLILSASTGALMAFKSEVRSVLRTTFVVVAKPSPPIPSADDRELLPVHALVRLAQTRHGRTALLQIRFPDGDGGVATIFLASDQSSRPDASKQISMDGYTGAELGLYSAGTLPASNEFIDWLYPIHTGQVLGTPGRLILLASALLLVGLSASGLWLWFSRRRQRRAKRGKPSAEVQPSVRHAE